VGSAVEEARQRRLETPYADKQPVDNLCRSPVMPRSGARGVIAQDVVKKRTEVLN